MKIPVRSGTYFNVVSSVWSKENESVPPVFRKNTTLEALLHAHVAMAITIALRGLDYN
jgi:hypothetical protein